MGDSDSGWCATPNKVSQWALRVKWRVTRYVSMLTDREGEEDGLREMGQVRRGGREHSG